MTDYGYIALFGDHQTSDKLSTIGASQYLDVKPVMNITAIGSAAGDFSELCLSNQFVSAPL